MIAPQPFFRPRGTPFSVLHRIRALLKLGHSVELVTYPFGESPPALNGVVIHRTRRVPGVRDVAIGPSIAKVLLDVPLFVTAYSLARTGQFDLLHTHEEAGAMGAWIKKKCGITHLYDMHSSLPQQFSNFGRYNWRPVVAAFQTLERYTLKGADGVIAICPELHDHVAESGYDRPLALIENTLDFEVPPINATAVKELRNRLGLATASIVLYTGTLEAYQGLDLLIDAAPPVVRAQPSVHFLFVGGSQRQITDLRQRARDRGVDKHFVFVPAVPPTEVFLYHRLADVLITTRVRGTNTPLKIYQYLRAGRPIVATAIRSHTQVLDPTSAELVTPTPDGIAAGLIRTVTDAERARDLAAGAARLARERYGEEVYLERLRGLLHQVGGGNRRQVEAK
jgi:glycosyltransferase involved in cell wall biosynthesis